jgi:C4-dicarboxylate-binding protein DctP
VLGPFLENLDIFNKEKLRMKPNKLLRIFVSGLLAVAISSPFLASAQSQLRLSTHFGQSDPPGKGVAKFKELVEQKSGGRIAVRVWWNSELGKERENTEMVRDGSIEMTTSLASGVGGWVPETALLEFPYIYKDDAHMLRVVNAVRPHLDEILAPYNFKTLGAIDVGFRYILTKQKPIQSIADLKGVKLRVPNPFYAALFDSLGARSAILPWPDIYVGLQSGVIDAMEASPALIQSMRFQEQAKFLSRTNHIAAVNVFLTGKKWYDALPKDLQQVINEASDEASRYQFTLQAASETESVKALVSAGAKLNDLKDPEEFRKAAITFREKYVKEKGVKWETLYRKMLAVQ